MSAVVESILCGSLGALVVVNGVMSERFTLSRCIRQSCLLSPMLYVLALQSFVRKLKANPLSVILSRPSISSVLTTFLYSQKNTADINEVRKDIDRYETVAKPKSTAISVGLQFGEWEGVTLLEPISWTDAPVKIFGIWVGPSLQLKMNWSEVRKFEAVARLWTRGNISFKGDGENLCFPHLPNYHLSVLPLSSTELMNLVRDFFHFPLGVKSPLVHCEVC